MRLQPACCSRAPRLPSWRDLAAQLGVARGTVRAAYDRLSDQELVVTSGSAGTFVAEQQSAPAQATSGGTHDNVLPPGLMGRGFRHPAIFQTGAPAHDAFPLKVWSRLYRKAVEAAYRQARAEMATLLSTRAVAIAR